jgi:hypothetical protein
MESNHPTVGLPRPAGFEDQMGHQTPAAPLAIVDRMHPGRRRDQTDIPINRGKRKTSSETDRSRVGIATATVTSVAASS